MSGHRRFQKSVTLSGIATTAVCPPNRSWTICGHVCRGNTKLPRLWANGFGWISRPLASPVWQVCFGLWDFIGTLAAMSGNIRAAASILLALIRPTRASNIALIFPSLFKTFDTMNPNRHRLTSPTVSETVSEKGRKAVPNYGGLTRIILETPSILTILPLLNRPLQVAAQPDPPN